MDCPLLAHDCCPGARQEGVAEAAGLASGTPPATLGTKLTLCSQTTDDPYLLFQFTGLFLSRDFGVKATIEAVEKRGLLELRHFLSTKTTAHPELMIEMIYYLLRSFLRHRGPGVTLEPISENIQEFIEHWTPLVKDNEYCATQLVSFQQFMISVAF